MRRNGIRPVWIALLEDALLLDFAHACVNKETSLDKTARTQNGLAGMDCDMFSDDPMICIVDAEALLPMLFESDIPEGLARYSGSL